MKAHLGNTVIVWRFETTIKAALVDYSCVFYDGSSVSAQDLLGPASSMSTIF